MGESTIGASDLYVAGCRKVIAQADGSRIDAEQVQQALPTQDALHHLSRNVLGLSDWALFETRYAQAQEGVRW
jgi:hypothetical protein